MKLIITLLWCCWAVLQLVAAVATAAGKDSAADLSLGPRRLIATGFALAAVSSVAAGVTRSPVLLGVAVVLSLASPLTVGILTDSVQPRHHAGRLVVLACLVILTGVMT